MTLTSTHEKVLDTVQKHPGSTIGQIRTMLRWSTSDSPLSLLTCLKTLERQNLLKITKVEDGCPVVVVPV